MAKKVFTSKLFRDLFYEVLEEFWLDDDTYVMVFQDMYDKDGDKYHLEVEYHKDEDRVTFVRVYENENVDARDMITHVFKTQIEEYILQKVGVVTGILNTQKIAVELTLDIDPKMSVGEMHEWLKSLEISATTYKDDKARVIRAENLGWYKG